VVTPFGLVFLILSVVANFVCLVQVQCIDVLTNVLTQVPPRLPLVDVEEMVHIDPNADVVPGCKYDIRAVPAHTRNGCKTFVLVVSPDPEVCIDNGKLARKYSEIYNNIRYLCFESLFHPGESMNVNMVNELCAN